MTFSRGRVVSGWVTASLLGCFAFMGCASTSTLERRKDGIYHLRCKDASLAQCLVKAEDACERTRYAVLRAFDDHEYMGRIMGSDAHEVRDSEVFFMCGMRTTWGNDLSKLRSQPLGDAKDCPLPDVAPAPPPAPPPARRCTPGASQACIGPAGCTGGQACVPDGAGFGPCDCGGTAPTPP